MSINIKDYFIHQRLPESLNDRNVKQLAELSDKFLHKVDALIGKVLIYPNIDNLDEELINHLGYQQHIERFSTDLPLKSKRELVKNSFLIHRYKGTPWAVETAIALMLAPTEIQEWFNYGGKPYHFRPVIDMTDARVVFDKAQKAELYKIIHSTKNVRSWLDSIIVALHPEDTVEMPNEETRLLLNLGYEDLIPYGGINADVVGSKLILPFTLKPERNLNIDELSLKLDLNVEDSYASVIEVGYFDAGEKAVVGGLMPLPIDASLNLTLELTVEDEVPKVTDNAGSLTVTHIFQCGQKAVVGAFCFGEQSITDTIDGDLQLTKEGALEVWQNLALA